MGLALAIAAGSILPDLDHILPPFHRAWGHGNPAIIMALGCGLFLFGMGLTYRRG